MACATLQAEPPCFLPGLGIDIPGLHCSTFPGYKGFTTAGAFFFRPIFFGISLRLLPPSGISAVLCF